MTRSKETIHIDGSDVNGSGKKIAIVAARWHDDIVGTLVDGALNTLLEMGVETGDILIVRVPGCYEIPVLTATLARSGKIHAVITLGVVIRGETAHFEYVAGPVAHEVQRIAVDTRIPCIFGVLTTENVEQARERAGGIHGHKGREAAIAALETLDALERTHVRLHRF